MRRACLFLLLVVLSSAPAAQTGRTGTAPVSDGVVRLVADVESALQAGSMERLRALTAPVLSTNGLLILQRAVASGGVSQAAVRERARRPLEEGRVEVLAEVFVSHGRNGRLATWIVTVRARNDSPDRYEIVSLEEPAAFDSLVKLTLNSDRQFNVHNLQLQAPDMMLKMASGSAFVAEDDGGITAIVLRGRGTLRFAPQDRAEQGQVRAFAGRPYYESDFDSAYVRLDSGEFSLRMSERSLVPAASVDSRELSRAREIFDTMASKTYNVDLKDLTPDDWSFSPSFGSVVVEFKTSRFGWLTYARSPSEAEDVVLFDRGRTRNISSYTSAEKASLRGADYSEDDLVSYDVERYALDVNFDPRTQQVSGRASILLKIEAYQSNVVTLRLAESLAVRSVSSPTLGRLLAMRIVGQSSLIINLPSAVPRDTQLQLDVVYSGRLNPQGADRESPAGVVPISTGDPQGRPEQPLVIQPEQRWLYSNQVYWYPQSQVTDYATATMRLQVPAEYQILANGRVESAINGATDVRATRAVQYVVDRPARYLSCLITRLVEVGRTKVDVAAIAPPMLNAAGSASAEPGVIDVDVFSTPRMVSANRATPARVGEMLRFYTELVGEAPYPYFTVAGVDDNLPGGHSPAFFSIWLQPLPSTPFSWASDPLSLDSRYSQFFLAHEVAHQWWGQAVGWKNYHEQWLSEGMAQYFAALFAGNDRGREMLDDLIAEMRSSAESYTERGPISLGNRLGQVQNDSRIFRAVVYNKSAVILHMLRRLIGDQAFYGGLRRYYTNWRYSKAGTEDFRTAMQAETPIRLNRFFQRWIRETGVPQLRVSSRIEPDGSLAVIRIQQVGDVFDLPLTVTVQYAEGSTEEITIPVTEALTEYPIRLKGAVKRINTRDALTLAEYVK
jgi:hypothetical protein